jgi:glycosyltransferase involved in cell wall biosynthesis
VLDHLVGASDTGRDRRLDGGPRQALLRMIDAVALGSADLIVVDTDEHLANLPVQHRDHAIVVHVGAPAAWHEAGRAADERVTGEGAPSGSPDPLRVVFYGLYTPLQGTPTIGAALGAIAAAADAPAIDVTMIGHGQDEAEAKSAAAGSEAVTWLDWVPAADLPELVAAHDVALGIFGTGGKAHRVVPNKVFQGAAAGCAIVTSDTAPQRRVFGDAAVLVPPGNADALASALLELARDRPRLRELRIAARELAEKRFAPAQVVGPLVEFIGGTHRSLAWLRGQEEHAQKQLVKASDRNRHPSIQPVDRG